eukprot:3147227-Pleurochrysis_carterae.AAC.2
MRMSTRSGADRARHLVVIGGHAALERGALHRAWQRSAKAQAQLRADRALPTEAVSPRMKPKTVKRLLGSPTAEAEELMT